MLHPDNGFRFGCYQLCEIIAASLLANSRLFTGHLGHDGLDKLKTFQVLVGNGRFYGGGMTVHANTAATDGMLDF